MSNTPSTNTQPIFLGREISAKDRLKLQGKKPGDTPCRRDAELYSSVYLEDFDEDMFEFDHPELSSDDLKVMKNEARAEHEKYQKAATNKALELCQSCPLLTTCREWVLEVEPHDGMVYGVVGGMTALERKKTYKRAARKAKQEAKKSVPL